MFAIVDGAALQVIVLPVMGTAHAIESRGRFSFWL
jgi:hypothetical protein